jgi:DNA-binding XRE family transcriptional regulator
MTALIDSLLADAEAWCAEKRGRQTVLARAIGVERQTVSAWFKRKQRPTGEQALALQKFLRESIGADE